MEKYELANFICKANDTLVMAMEKIDFNARGIVYVVDREEHLVGSLSDGDIRRWILRKGSLDGSVFDVCYRNVKYLHTSELKYSIDFMRTNGIKSVPVLDENYIITQILFMEDTVFADTKKYSDTLTDFPIIIMAGGKGTRLYPYTKILPKPLIPIGEVPILERILNKFYDYGAEKFYLTVNYKKEMIKSYFMETDPPYSIQYIEETEPLGTAGSIRLIKKQFENPIIIANCDSLIEVDYEEVLQYHLSSHNDMTIISSLKNIVVPYGVLETREHGIIVSIHEKPQLSYMINTGMYIVNPEFLEWIPENRVFHMTDLTEKMIEKGKQVGMYPISENSFLDMGEFEEMKRMEEQINSGHVN